MGCRPSHRVRSLRSIVWDGDKRVTQPYGPTSLTVEPIYDLPLGPVHWHCGIDIGDMPVGTPLRAARAGVVSRIGYGLLGIRVSTQTDFYVHIDRATVQLGQAVVAGQLVAYSGNKVPQGGYITGPHLHFEVQVGALNVPATSKDPVPVLTAAFSGSSGSLEANDLTDDQALQLKNTTDKVNEVWDLLRTGFHFATNPRWIYTELEAIKAKPAAAAPDLTAISAKLDALAADVAAIRTKVDRDLA